jgi:HJR/Mrr/RecB family endonuclease
MQPLGVVGGKPNVAHQLSEADRRRWVEIKAHLLQARRERLFLLAAWLFRKSREAIALIKIPAWIAALVIGSITAILFSAILIVGNIGGSFLLLGFCLLGYILGGGGTFLLFVDERGESDENRLRVRQMRVTAIDEKRRALALKISGLEAELSLQNRAIETVMQAARSRVFAAAEEAKRAAEAQAAAAVANAEAGRRIAETRAQAATAELESARAALAAVQDAANRATDQLLSIDPGRLYPDELERFAAQIFSHLGYNVQQTGQTGDQGVDVVAEKLGFRLAIQVKCYSNTVGNSAVQEVFAGMMHYGCNRCLVFTNNYFTSSAIALARSTGCLLIDRESIASLIRGEFSL